MKINVNPKRKGELSELLIVVVAALAPMWLMAGDWSDMDEVVKSGVGIACVGAVVAAYRIWKGATETDAN